MPCKRYVSCLLLWALQDAISGACSLIDQVMLFGQDERFLGAIVCLNPLNMRAAGIISQVTLRAVASVKTLLSLLFGAVCRASRRWLYPLRCCLFLFFVNRQPFTFCRKKTPRHSLPQASSNTVPGEARLCMPLTDHPCPLSSALFRRRSGRCKSLFWAARFDAANNWTGWHP